MGNMGNNHLSHHQCMEMLDRVLDDEMEETEEFRIHLKTCMPCYEQYNLDKTIKTVLKKKCLNEPVPENLSQLIRQTIISGKQCRE